MGKCLSKSSDADNLEINNNKSSQSSQSSQSISDKQLMDIDITTVPNVIFQNFPIRARVIDVYDGDTITVIFLIEDSPILFKIRLSGIDTPEIKTGKGKLKTEKIAGKKCRDYLSNLIGDKLINLTILDWDKYGGRLIGIIKIDDNTNINNVMINRGYARPYDGGKKLKWTRSELRKIININ